VEGSGHAFLRHYPRTRPDWRTPRVRPCFAVSVSGEQNLPLVRASVCQGRSGSRGSWGESMPGCPVPVQGPTSPSAATSRCDLGQRHSWLLSPLFRSSYSCSLSPTLTHSLTSSLYCLGFVRKETPPRPVPPPSLSFPHQHKLMVQVGRVWVPENNIAVSLTLHGNTGLPPVGTTLQYGDHVLEPL